MTVYLLSDFEAKAELYEACKLAEQAEAEQTREDTRWRDTQARFEHLKKMYPALAALIETQFTYDLADDYQERAARLQIHPRSDPELTLALVEHIHSRGIMIHTSDNGRWSSVVADLIGSDDSDEWVEQIVSAAVVRASKIQNPGNAPEVRAPEVFQKTEVSTSCGTGPNVETGSLVQTAALLYLAGVIHWTEESKTDRELPSLARAVRGALALRDDVEQALSKTE